VSTADVTLVLSGGGAKTAAHLGAWRALREAGMTPSRCVATSMGAVIGAGLAAGVGPDELLERLVEVGQRGIVRDPLAPVTGLFARSLLKPAPFRRAIEALVPARRFADLGLPLTIAVTDLDSWELLRFGAAGQDAPLIDVLCATCALPLYFPPVELAGRRCADGGLHGVLPLEAAAAVAVSGLVVAVDVGAGPDVPPGPDSAAPSMVRVHDDSLGILMASHGAARLALWRAERSRPPLIHVRPRVERNATFRVEEMRRYAEEGYRAARDALRAGPPAP